MIALFSNVVERFTALPRALRLIRAAVGGWLVAWAGLLLIQGLLPAAIVFLSGRLIDVLAASSGEGLLAAGQAVIVLAAAIGGLLILTEFLQSASEWLRSILAEYLQDHIAALVHAQSTSVDLAFYESPDYYDHLHRARDESGSRSLALLENVGSMMQDGITLIAMAAILIPYGIWLPIALIASATPALYVVLRTSWRYHTWWERTTEDRRWSEYYEMMMTSGDVAPELRLFGLGAPFQSAYTQLRARLRGERLRLVRNQSLSQLAAAATTTLISGLALAWMLWRVLQGILTIGDLVLFYQAFQQGQNLMRTLLGNFGQLYSNSLFLSNLFEFLDLKPQIADPATPVAAPTAATVGVRFRDIGFRYPESERTVLDGFNLSIPAGQVVAIVGDNGAGKSTLVKLLCRFYDPYAGAVEIAGQDIRSLRLADLRRMVTVLFQDPVPYHTTAGDNIALGDLSNTPDQQALEAGGARRWRA